MLGLIAFPALAQIKTVTPGLSGMGEIGGRFTQSWAPDNDLTFSRVTSFAPGTFTAMVINVTWNQVQPSNGGECVTTTIDHVLNDLIAPYNAAHPATPLVARLRIWAGPNAPLWVLAINSIVVTHQADQVASFTGAIAGTVLTAGPPAGTPGTLAPGQILNTPSANTVITAQVDGSPGGAGTYTVSQSQSVASQTMTAWSGGHTMTVPYYWTTGGGSVSARIANVVQCLGDIYDSNPLIYSVNSPISVSTSDEPFNEADNVSVPSLVAVPGTPRTDNQKKTSLRQPWVGTSFSAHWAHTPTEIPFSPFLSMDNGTVKQPQGGFTRTDMDDWRCTDNTAPGCGAVSAPFLGLGPLAIVGNHGLNDGVTPLSCPVFCNFALLGAPVEMQMGNTTAATTANILNGISLGARVIELFDGVTGYSSLPQARLTKWGALIRAGVRAGAGARGLGSASLGGHGLGIGPLAQAYYDLCALPQGGAHGLGPQGGGEC